MHPQYTLKIITWLRWWCCHCVLVRCVASCPSTWRCKYGTLLFWLAGPASSGMSKRLSSLRPPPSIYIYIYMYIYINLIISPYLSHFSPPPFIFFFLSLTIDFVANINNVHANDNADDDRVSLGILSLLEEKVLRMDEGDVILNTLYPILSSLIPISHNAPQ